MREPHKVEGSIKGSGVKLLALEITRTLPLTKEAKIYNGEKTTSLTSGAGKTGQPLVKE